MIFLCSVLKGNSFEAWYKSGFPNLPAFLDLVGDLSLQTEIFDVLSFCFVLILFFKVLSQKCSFWEKLVKRRNNLEQMFCTSITVCAARQSGSFRKEAFYQQIYNLSNTTDCCSLSGTAI